MKEKLKYIIALLAFLLGLWLIWYFKSIVFFLLLSAVLSLVSRPIFDLIKKVHIGKFRMSNALAALLSIIFIWVLILTFFRFSVPVVLSEIRFLSEVDMQSVFPRIERLLESLINGSGGQGFGLTVYEFIEDQLKQMALTFFDFTRLNDVLGSIVGFLGGAFVLAFAVSFITFFLLKDEWLLLESILLFVPAHYEDSLKHMLNSIKHLLRRYFVGVLFQILLISLFVTAGFGIIGIPFEHAIVVGLFCGFINVIPYLGPFIGAFFGILVGLIVYLQMLFPPDFMVFFWGMFLVFVIVQLLDNLVFQPIIFSSSVKAHPLEIFIIILMAGYMAGIPGMFLAIPVYTILRVVAREFFFNYNLVKKLTKKLRD